MRAHHPETAEMSGRNLCLALCTAFAVTFGFLFSAPPAHATAAAEKFIQENIDKGYTILNNKSFSDEQRRTEFRNFMLRLTDTDRIAKFTLGKYVRGASPAEIQAFDDAFTDYAVVIYESRLGKYTGQTMKVTGSLDRAADDTVVNANVVNPSAPDAPPIKAAFRVRLDSHGNPIIIDMQVEGVWLAINQRADFTSYLQQHNGSIPALTQHLKELVTTIRSGAPVDETGSQ